MAVEYPKTRVVRVIATGLGALMSHAAAQRTHAADVATRGPKPAGLGSLARLRATRPRFTRHAADASR